MTDRRRQDLELALHNLLAIREPDPKNPSLKTSAGFAPTERVPCPDCGHTETPGWRVDAFRRRSPCVTCGGHTVPTGRGGEWVKRDAGHGVVAVDPMDASRAVVGSADTRATARPVRMVTCDSCNGEGAHGNGQRCGYCDGHGKRPLHAFNLTIDTRDVDAVLDHVQRQVDQRQKDPRWVQLERALADLARGHVRARQIVQRVHVEQVKTIGDLSTRGLETLEFGMRYLLMRLPEEWRAPAGLRANAKTLEERRTRAKARGSEGRGSDAKRFVQRDKEIREHARSGRSVQWIAVEYGLSVRTVYEVVNRKREEAA